MVHAARAALHSVGADAIDGPPDAACKLHVLGHCRAGGLGQGGHCVRQGHFQSFFHFSLMLASRPPPQLHLRPCPGLPCNDKLAPATALPTSLLPPAGAAPPRPAVHSLMVTRLAWMAQRLQSSSRCTMKSSAASWSASSPSLVHRNGSGAMSLVISRTCAQQPRAAACGWQDLGKQAALQCCSGSETPSCGLCHPLPGETRPHHPASAAVHWCVGLACVLLQRAHRLSSRRPLTSRANGSFLMSRLVVRWNLRISRSATVPGRNRCGFSAHHQGSKSSGQTAPQYPPRRCARCWCSGQADDAQLDARRAGGPPQAASTVRPARPIVSTH